MTVRSKWITYLKENSHEPNRHPHDNQQPAAKHEENEDPLSGYLQRNNYPCAHRF